MSALDRMILVVAARSPAIKRALQRWALRYCARLLGKLGGAHAHSAELLLMIGGPDNGEHTLTGRPMPRRPARVVVPELPQLNGRGKP